MTTVSNYKFVVAYISEQEKRDARQDEEIKEIKKKDKQQDEKIRKIKSGGSGKGKETGKEKST